MVAHLGHTSMIHSSAWLPLIIWSLESLKKKFTATWYLLGCFGFSFCLLAGHFQIYTFAVGLGAVYVLAGMNSACQGRGKYLSQFISMVILSLGFSGIQILPTLELAGQGMRAALSFETFNQYNLPLFQIPILLFPFLYGGSPQSFYGLNYFGEWNFLEMTGYLGYLPLLLAAAGIFICKNRPLVWVWIVIAILAFLLALGDGTPLAHLMYWLPGYNKFRAPSRHFVELSLAISVLAGLGITAMQRGELDKKLALKMVLGGSLIIATCLASIYLMSDRLQQSALGRGCAWNWLPG